MTKKISSFSPRSDDQDKNNNDGGRGSSTETATTSVYGIEELDRHAKIQRMYLSPNDSTYSR